MHSGLQVHAAKSATLQVEFVYVNLKTLSGTALDPHVMTIQP